MKSHALNVSALQENLLGWIEICYLNSYGNCKKDEIAAIKWLTP